MTSPALPLRVPADASRMYAPSSLACTHLLNTRTGSRLPLRGPSPGETHKKEITAPERAELAGGSIAD